MFNNINLYNNNIQFHSQGTNFEHLELLKYNESMNCVCSYYITSVAVDLSSQLQKTFQIRVDEKSFGDLDLTVSVARPNDEEKGDFLIVHCFFSIKSLTD